MIYLHGNSVGSEHPFTSRLTVEQISRIVRLTLIESFPKP